MKDTKPKFLDKLEENQLAQEINSIEEINNNPVIKEDNNNPVNKTNMIEPNPPKPNPNENVIDLPVEQTPTRKPTTNTVRIMDGNFTF